MATLANYQITATNSWETAYTAVATGTLLVGSESVFPCEVRVGNTAAFGHVLRHSHEANLPLPVKAGEIVQVRGQQGARFVITDNG